MSQFYVCPGGNACNEADCSKVCKRRFTANSNGICADVTGVNGEILRPGCKHWLSYHDVEIQPTTDGMDMIFFYFIFLVLTCTLTPYAPGSINGEPVIGRLDVCEEIVSFFLNNLGTFSFLYLNQNFGSGKTFIAYKFRSVLFDPANSEFFKKIFSLRYQEKLLKLKNSVYICVRMRGFVKNCKIPPKIEDAYLFAEKLICREIYLILQLAGFASNLKVKKSDDLLIYLKKLCPRTTLLLNLDEVNAFNGSANIFYILTLYACVKIAHSFKAAGHFVILTGRAEELNLIGKGLQLTQFSSSIVSPSPGITVNLPLFSKTEIESLILYNLGSLHAWLDDEKLLTISKFSGGVPRLVTAFINKISFANVLTVQAFDEEIWDDIVKKLCPIPNVEVFNCLLVFVWSKMTFTLNTLLNGCYLCDILTYFGFYYNSIGNGKFIAVMPYCIVNFYNRLSGNSLFSKMLVNNSGERSELGFQNAYHLRVKTLLHGFSAASWSDLRLKFLDVCLVPFPISISKKEYVFPKIVGINELRSKNDAINFMKKSNCHDTNIEYSEFPVRLLSELCSLMIIGCYYISFAKSKFSDACIRLNKDTLLHMQFKNYTSKISQVLINNEALKCKVSSFKNILVIISFSFPSSKKTQVGDVEVIVLSEKSVRNFFGANLSEMIESKSLVAEATKCISNSPEKPLINAANILKGFSKINLDFNDDEEIISFNEGDNNNEFIIQKNELRSQKEKGGKLHQKIKESTLVRTKDEQKSMKSLKQATVKIKATVQSFANAIGGSELEDYTAKNNIKRRATHDPNENYSKIPKRNKSKRFCNICNQKCHHSEVNCLSYYCKVCNNKHAQSKPCINTNATPLVTEDNTSSKRNGR